LQFKMNKEIEKSLVESVSAIKLEELIANSPILTKAYNITQKAHEGQTRAEGIPYFTHCVEVARILYQEWGISDTKIIAAGLLHDTVEDSKDIGIPTIETEFGSRISLWIEGVTQLRSERGSLNKEELDRETLQKVNSASYIEPLVGIIKLADRLHNMRTLMHMPQTKQVSKARETLFYAKLAESLGMWEVMRELEDLSFKYTEPSEYEKYLKMRDDDPRTKPEFVDGIKSRLDTILQDNGIEARVETTKNSLLRVRDKRGKYLPEKIDDLVRFGIIIKEGESVIETRNRVMIALGALWQEFDPIEDKGRFDNFYFTRRDNGYSALHLTLGFPEGNIKVAVTSEDKENYNSEGVLSLLKKGGGDLHKYALKLVFTPTREAKFFRAGATGVDYAYSISNEMGASAEYMLVDGKYHEITEIIPNGSQIEIKRSASRRVPKSVVKNFAAPGVVKKIDEQLSYENRWKDVVKGKEDVGRIIFKRGLIDLADLGQIDKYSIVLKDLLSILGCKDSIENLYYKVGSGVMYPKLLEEYLDKYGITKDGLGLTSVLVEGLDVPGIFTSTSSAITELGGNIGPLINTPHESSQGTTFSLRMIVENLSKTDEETLLKKLKGGQQITKVVVV